MRLLPIRVSGSVRLSTREPELSTTTAPICSPHDFRWQPYSNSKDFQTNAVMILLILFCALICALALHTTVCCFLRRRADGSGPPASAEERKPEVGLAAVMPVVYRARMEGELQVAAAECAICLSEFVDGEEVQVLGSCKHGFHGGCIQKWLASRSSCPTCRSDCLLSTSYNSPENQQR